MGIDPARWTRLHELALVAGSAAGRTDEPSALITECLAASDGYSLGSDVMSGRRRPDPPAGHRGDRRATGRGRLDGRTVLVPIDIARSAASA